MLTIRRTLRKITMKDYGLREMVAYHEAAHAVLGYLFNHKVLEININFDIANNTPAYTLKNYGNDQAIIDCFNRTQSSLGNFHINRVMFVAKCYCCSLLAGPIAETFYQYGTNYRNGIISQDKPDFNLTFDTASMIYSGQKVYDFIYDCSNLTSDLLRENEVWSTVTLLAKRIMNNKNLKIFEREIYDCFESGGLIKYKESK